MDRDTNPDKNPVMHRLDLGRYHHAAKLIETDGADAYWTCRQKYGADIANVLLIAFLRRSSGSEGSECWPPEGGYERIEEEVNEWLEEHGFLERF